MWRRGEERRGSFTGSGARLFIKDAASVPFISFSTLFFFFSLLRSALETKAMDTDKWPPQGCVRRVTVQSDNSATLVAEMIWLPDDDKQVLDMNELGGNHRMPPKFNWFD